MGLKGFRSRFDVKLWVKSGWGLGKAKGRIGLELMRS